MKKLFTLFIICLYVSVNAQITYTETDGPRIGLRIYTRSLLNPQSYDLNHLIETGGNKSWDLRGAFEEGDTTEYIGVDNLPFKSSYPGCNMALVNVPNTDNSYAMFEKNSTGLYWLGSHNDMSDIVLSPKYKFIAFPLNFSSNFQNSVNADYKIDTFDIKLDVQSNSTVDAWGMMTTNDGTFPVIKMKTVQIRELSFAGIPFGSTSFTYNWLASGFGHPLATLDISEVENFTGLVTDTTIEYTHKQEIVSSQDIAKSKLKLSITPNPVSDQVTIECQNVKFNSATYSIINADGKSVLNGELKSNEVLRLNLNQLTSGNYLVYLVLDKKTTLFEILSKN
jgi:hypothetical protein